MYLWITSKKYCRKLPYYVIIITCTLLIYNMKLKLFILITLSLACFAELLTDFGYTNFTVGLSNVDALDRLRVHLNIILLGRRFVKLHTVRPYKLLWRLRHPFFRFTTLVLSES